MKPQKEPKKSRFNTGHLMYITVIVASISLVGTNVFLRLPKEKVRVLCGSFFNRIKGNELDVVPVNPDVTRGGMGDDSPSAYPMVSGKININTATAEELQTLSGIGETKAAAIVHYRTENGDFKNIEEICRVEGIGDTTFNKIRDKITV